MLVLRIAWFWKRLWGLASGQLACLVSGELVDLVFCPGCHKKVQGTYAMQATCSDCNFHCQQCWMDVGVGAGHPKLISYPPRSCARCGKSRKRLLLPDLVQCEWSGGFNLAADYTMHRACHVTVASMVQAAEQSAEHQSNVYPINWCEIIWPKKSPTRGAQGKELPFFRTILRDVTGQIEVMVRERAALRSTGLNAEEFLKAADEGSQMVPMLCSARLVCQCGGGNGAKSLTVVEGMEQDLQESLTCQHLLPWMAPSTPAHFYLLG